MAFSSEKKARSVAGTLLVEIHSWNAASVTSGTINTGIQNILHAQVNNLVSEGQGLAVPSGANVALSSVVSNDTGTLVVWGY